MDGKKHGQWIIHESERALRYEVPYVDGKMHGQWVVQCEIHQLQHTAATELVNSGVGVGTVRQILGHRNLQTTQRYAELSGRAGYSYASSSRPA